MPPSKCRHEMWPMAILPCKASKGYKTVRSQSPKRAVTPLPLHRHLGVALLTDAGRIVGATPAFAEVVGSSVQSILGQSVFVFFQSLTPLTSRTQLNDSTNIVVERLGKSYCLAFHKIARGAAGSFVGLLYPIGESGFESRLLHRDRLAMLGELTATTAHELAGTLSVIANNAEVVLAIEGLDEELRSSMELMRDESQRVTGLLRDLIQLASNRPPDIKPLDIVAIVEKSVGLVRRQVPHKNLKVRFEIELGLPQVPGDAGHLQQLLTNLLKNAWDASQSQQEIIVYIQSARRRNRKRGVEIAIVDSGQGIEPDELEHIFDPFYSTKPSGEGTGLGLAIVRRIATAHDGEVRLTSNPGEGTRASVILPVYPIQHQQSKPTHLVADSKNLLNQLH